MSVVTAVLVLTGLTPGPESELLAALNAHCAQSTGLTDVTPHVGGSKHPQVYVFGGAFNYLDEAAYLTALRTFPWTDYDCTWAQVAMHGENSDGFGLVDVYRDADVAPAWRAP